MIIRYTASRSPNRKSEFQKQAKTLCFQWIIIESTITQWVTILLKQKNTKLSYIVTYENSDSSHTLPALDSLVAVAELIKRPGLSLMIDRRLARRDSNRVYPARIIFNTSMRMAAWRRQVSGRCAAAETGIGADADDSAIRGEKAGGRRRFVIKFAHWPVRLFAMRISGP